MAGRTFIMYANPEVDSNILYASGFLAPDPYIFVEVDGRKVMVMSDLEIDRAKAQSKANDVLSLSKLSETITGPGKPLAPTADIIAVLLKQFKVKAAEVPFGFPVMLADALRKKGFKLTPVAEPFFPERLLKTPGEIEFVASVQARVELSMKAAALAFRSSIVKGGKLYLGGKPLTSEEVKKIINLALMTNNIVGAHTIVACGDQGVDPHNEGQGQLYADLPIIIDIFPRSMDTMRMARSMLELAIVWMPQAAASTLRASGLATCVSMPARAASASSCIAPPRNQPGSR